MSQTLPEAAPVHPRLQGIKPGQISFVAAPTALAHDSRLRLVARYGDCNMMQADVVVALGGDGFMLETLHKRGRSTPVYGMNCGSVGFLMNTFSEDDLPNRLSVAQEAVLYPLRRHVVTAAGVVEEALAVNEVSLLRQLRHGIEDPHHGGRAGAAAGADLRRRAAVHAGRVDRLQPVGAWSDRAAIGQPAAADADQRIPPPPLARRAAAQHRRRAVRVQSRTSARPPPWPTSPRSATLSRSRSARIAACMRR